MVAKASNSADRMAVIAAYHRLFQVEASFRMSNMTSPPGRSTTTNAIRRAHLSIVLCALAVSRLIEERTG